MPTKKKNESKVGERHLLLRHQQLQAWASTRDSRDPYSAAASDNPVRIFHYALNYVFNFLSGKGTSHLESRLISEQGFTSREIKICRDNMLTYRDTMIDESGHYFQAPNLYGTGLQDISLCPRCGHAYYNETFWEYECPRCFLPTYRNTLSQEGEMKRLYYLTADEQVKGAMKSVEESRRMRIVDTAYLSVREIVRVSFSTPIAAERYDSLAIKFQEALQDPLAPYELRRLKTKSFCSHNSHNHCGNSADNEDVGMSESMTSAGTFKSLSSKECVGGNEINIPMVLVAQKCKLFGNGDLECTVISAIHYSFRRNHDRPYMNVTPIYIYPSTGTEDLRYPNEERSYALTPMIDDFISMSKHGFMVKHALHDQPIKVRIHFVCCIADCKDTLADILGVHIRKCEFDDSTICCNGAVAAFVDPRKVRPTTKIIPINFCPCDNPIISHEGEYCDWVMKHLLNNSKYNPISYTQSFLKPWTTPVNFFTKLNLDLWASLIGSILPCDVPSWEMFKKVNDCRFYEKMLEFTDDQLSEVEKILNLFWAGRDNDGFECYDVNYLGDAKKMTHFISVLDEVVHSSSLQQGRLFHLFNEILVLVSISSSSEVGTKMIPILEKACEAMIEKFQLILEPTHQPVVGQSCLNPACGCKDHFDSSLGNYFIVIFNYQRAISKNITPIRRICMAHLSEIFHRSLINKLIVGPQHGWSFPPVSLFNSVGLLTNEKFRVVSQMNEVLVERTLPGAPVPVFELILPTANLQTIQHTLQSERNKRKDMEMEKGKIQEFDNTHMISPAKVLYFTPYNHVCKDSLHLGVMSNYILTSAMSMRKDELPLDIFTSKPQSSKSLNSSDVSESSTHIDGLSNCSTLISLRSDKDAYDPNDGNKSQTCFARLKHSTTVHTPKSFSLKDMFANMFIKKENYEIPQQPANWVKYVRVLQMFRICPCNKTDTMSDIINTRLSANSEDYVDYAYVEVLDTKPRVIPDPEDITDMSGVRMGQAYSSGIGLRTNVANYWDGTSVTERRLVTIDQLDAPVVLYHMGNMAKRKVSSNVYLGVNKGKHKAGGMEYRIVDPELICQVEMETNEKPSRSGVKHTVIRPFFVSEYAVNVNNPMCELFYSKAIGRLGIDGTVDD